MNIGEVGQLVSQRYQLTSLFPVQVSGATVWSAVDTYRSFNVRLILLDPAHPTTVDALDAARRAALFNSTRTVRVLSVSENDESPAWICTEVPLGEPLAEAYTGMPFPPEQIHAVVGEVATILNEARERGIRHLQISPSTVRVDVAGEVFVDGFGYLAALAGISTSDAMGTEMDRREAHGVVGLAASMLVGDPEVDPEAAIAEGAGDPDLDDQLRLVFSREAEGLGSLSPADLVRELAPWPRVSPHQFPHTQAKFGWEPPAFEPVASASLRPEWPLDSVADDAEGDDGDDILMVEDDEPQSVSLREENVVAGAVMSDDVAASAATPDIAAEAEDSEEEVSANGEDAPSDGEAAPADEVPVGEDSSAGEDVSAGEEGDLDVELGISPAPKVMVTPKWQTPEEFAAEAAEQEAQADRERAEAAGADAVMLIDTDESEPDNPTAVFERVEVVTDGAQEAETPDAAADNSGASMEEEPASEDVASEEPASEEAPSDEAPSVPVEDVTTDDEIGEDKIGEDEVDTSDAAEATEPLAPAPLAAQEAEQPSARPETLGQTMSTVQPTSSAQPANPTRPMPSVPDERSKKPAPRAESSTHHSRPAVAVTGPINKKNRSLSWIFTTGAIVLVCVAAVWALLTFFAPTKDVELTKPRLTAEPTEQTTESTQEPTPSATPSLESLPAPSVSSITLLNPQGDLLDPATVAEQDNPNSVVNAIDANPATSWKSWWYSNENFVRKEGIGLEIKLSAKAKVSEVDLQVNGQGGNVQWRNTTSATPNSGDVLTESAMSSATVLKPAEAQATDTIILWFTGLPTDSEGSYRIDLAEITVK